MRNTHARMRTDDTVQSVDRALRLLEALAACAGGARLSDLARHVGLPPSTAHRLLTTLQRRGFVQFDNARAEWHIGQQAFAVGVSFTRWQSLVATAMPYLRRLRDMTHETSNIGVLDGAEVITVAQIESREIIRAIAAPGGRAPIMNSGMGKAMIATWPDTAIEALVARQGLRPMTSHSLRNMDQVRAEIARVRTLGHAYDNEEFTPGMRCVAAAIHGPSGEVVAGLSVSALASRLPEKELPATGEIVKGLAQELTRKLSAA
ncbi:IclR family transcriptional regulator [Falsirhodobacter sp. alg1]|uniref:IclR family transcriptional regulator n=1 Tax=Falsirhodobacter sp. alg1 TaxID=1472418 RepID=UPI0005EF212B|nr:IclR family transcriptional regulator [Falsirhodobacter sp. alg1]